MTTTYPSHALSKTKHVAKLPEENESIQCKGAQNWTLSGNIDLGELTDDEFYLRLVALKEEHKKTLAMCEKIYSKKLQQNVYEDKVSSMENAKARNRPESGLTMADNAYNFSVYPTDKPPQMSTRNLTAATSVHISAQSRPKSVEVKHSDYLYGNITGLDDRNGKHPISNTWTAGLFSSNENLHQQTDGRGTESPIIAHNGPCTIANSKIEDMWDNFSIEDYAPRHRSRSGSRPKSAIHSPKLHYEDWRHRITIPKPFNITNHSKSRDKNSRTLDEFLKEKEERERDEELECHKQFKATPVPAHVYMPIYDKIVERQHHQQRKVKENCENLLKSQERPFTFLKREEEKRKYASKKMVISNDEEEGGRKTNFKARPFPATIFDTEIDDQMVEEEEYRRIRMQMRAEELLRSSSLPPNMQARSVHKKYKCKEKVNIPMSHEPMFHPKINKNIPDFEECHRRFLYELESKKDTKEATVVKPFTLRCGRTVKRPRNAYDIKHNNTKRLQASTKKYNRTVNFTLRNSLASSLDSIPAKMTTAHTYRTNATKSKLQKEMENDLAEKENQRRREQREQELKKHILDRELANDTTGHIARHSTGARSSKLEEYRESERARAAEYRDTLSEINERVEARPLLLERALQENARKQAERRFNSTLERTGLDVDHVTRLGSRVAQRSASTGSRTAVSDDDEFSATYAFSTKRSADYASDSHREDGE